MRKFRNFFLQYGGRCDMIESIPPVGAFFFSKKSPPAAALGYRGNVIYRSICSKFFCAFRQLRAVIPTKNSTPAASTISCIPKPSVWEFIAAMPGKWCSASARQMTANPAMLYRTKGLPSP